MLIKIILSHTVYRQMRQPHDQQVPAAYEIVDINNTSEGDSSTKSKLCRTDKKATANKNKCHKVKASSFTDEQIRRPQAPPQDYISPVSVSNKQSATKYDLSTSRHGNKVAVHKANDDENTYQPLVPSKEGADRSEYQSLMKNKRSKSSHIPPALPPKPEIKH